jgi:mono/diheme cytochrome c family protein
MKSIVLSFALFLSALNACGQADGRASGSAYGADVQQGKYLTSITGCANCHTANPSAPFAGGMAIKTSAGTFFSPNITMDPTYGIGSWTDAQFIQAMRHGVAADGRLLYPTFPYQSYSKLSDSDLLSIKAYLATFKPIAQPNREHDLGFFAGMGVSLRVWRSSDSMGGDPARLNGPRNFMFAEGPFRPVRGMDAQWNRGAYLVEGALHCAECHTPRSQGHLVLEKWMGGSSDKFMFTPNITPAADSFVANWTAKDWDRFLKTGRSPEGLQAPGDMGRVIRTQTSQLNSADRAAVIRYLMSLAPVAN